MGEQTDYHVDILDASMGNGSTIELETINKNRILLGNIKKGDLISVLFQIDFDEFCLMEASYYEYKK